MQSLLRGFSSPESTHDPILVQTTDQVPRPVALQIERHSCAIGTKWYRNKDVSDVASAAQLLRRLAAAVAWGCCCYDATTRASRSIATSTRILVKIVACSVTGLVCYSCMTMPGAIPLLCGTAHPTPAPCPFPIQLCLRCWQHTPYLTTPAFSTSFCRFVISAL